LKLRDDVRLELTAITEKGRAQFQAYKAALAGHTPGYSHLLQARELTAQAIEIDPQFDQSQALQTSIAAESRSLETALVTSENLKTKQKYDDALTAISAYVAFADEEPRIGAIVDAAYKFHLEQGNKFASSNNWQDAVRELRRAIEIKKTPEAAAALKKDEQGLEVASTRADADAALAKSAAFEGQKQPIAAYEVLADLPPASRALVVDRMQALRDIYIKSASDEAKICKPRIPRFMAETTKWRQNTPTTCWSALIARAAKRIRISSCASTCWLRPSAIIIWKWPGVTCKSRSVREWD
jgi:LPS O-antigen subunit length determinant protein (WzzB/FepE family)